MKKGMSKKLWLMPLILILILGIQLGVAIADEVTVSGSDLTIDGTPINQDTWYGKGFEFLKLGETWQQVVIALVILAIIAAGLFDILELVGLFENLAVKLIIAIGLGIVAAITGLIRWLVVWAAGLTATLGAIGIFLEVIIAIVLFIGLSFGGAWAAKFAAKRRAAKAVARGQLFAGNLKGLKAVAKAATTP